MDIYMCDKCKRVVAACSSVRIAYQNSEIKDLCIPCFAEMTNYWSYEEWKELLGIDKDLEE